ncbi:MAG: hypothetical protein IJ024_00990 [Lachnospiraceae bacterium]|nr:hypothetical protein [Lachnospiraceae bacterium]
MELSFAEQIKIILKRKNMTIQDLALLYESQTGIKMTRQNLSQRLRRDNFPEQDMHELAAMLGYQVSIQLTPTANGENIPVIPYQSVIPQPASVLAPSRPTQPKPPVVQKVKTADGSTVQIPDLFRKAPILGEINPMTGEEYLSNTVRQHPDMPKYVQVYDQSTHEWIDVNEDYFWEFQAKKKEIMGSDYQEPIVI